MSFIQAFYQIFELCYYLFYILLCVIVCRMITNLDEALEQNKRLVNETFRVTQEWEKTKAELIVLKAKMNNQPVTGNPFYRNSDREQLLEKLGTAEASLKNSEEMNLKLTRSRKETEKQMQEMEKQMKEMNLKLLTCYGQLKTKEEETVAMKAKLALYDNKEGSKQKIDELSAQLFQKESLLGIAWEELKVKDVMLGNAIKANQKIFDERRMIFEQSQKLKYQLDSNENINTGNESNLKLIIHNMEQEFKQIKVENNRMAEIIFGHEATKTQLEERIRQLEFQLDAYKVQPMMQPHNIQVPPSMMQPHSIQVMNQMNQMMESMNKMQMEIQHLNSQKMQQPRQ